MEGQLSDFSPPGTTVPPPPTSSFHLWRAQSSDPRIKAIIPRQRPSSRPARSTEWILIPSAPQGYLLAPEVQLVLNLRAETSEVKQLVCSKP